MNNHNKFLRETAQSSRPILIFYIPMNIPKRILLIGFISLILNLIWEFSHSSLYIHLSETPKYLHLITASFGDMLTIFGIFAIVSLKNKNLNWLKNPNKFDYILIVFLGLIVAVLVEIINLNLKRWAYAAAMPAILGIGASPLIQLALTGIASLIIIKYIEDNK